MIHFTETVLIDSNSIILIPGDSGDLSCLVLLDLNTDFVTSDLN